MNYSLPGLSKHIRVVISGGADGIGRTIAETFLAQQVQTAIFDISESAVAEYRKRYPHSMAAVVDVADARQVEAFFRQVANKLDGIDILINNVGIAGPTAAVEDISPADWERTLAVNLNGMFYCLRNAVPLLKAAGGGAVINIASSAAFFGYPLRSPYAASKWAAIGLTKTLAMELGPFNIRVNAICPGSVNGPRIQRVIEKEASVRKVMPENVRDIYLRQVSLRTFVDAEDVANTILFLCSDLGKNISGQALGVDGHTETLSNG